MEAIMDEYIPYVKSKKFPHMSMEKRARQFAPFSVLEGLDEAINKVKKESELAYEVVIEEEEEYVWENNF